MHDLFPGFTAPTDAERLAARTRGRLKAERAQLPPTHGLFDLNARGQADLVERARKAENDHD